MKKHMIRASLAALGLSVLAMFGCEQPTPTPPAPPNEQELITTLIATFVHTPADATQKKDTVVLSFKDVDGEGGNPPTLKVSGPFIKGVEYLGELSLLDESKNPIDTVTTEIEEEGEKHQFFFEQTSATKAFASVEYNDKDQGGQHPIGLKFKVTTSATDVSGAQFKITLRHQPNKTKANPVGAPADINQAGGETDIEVEFKEITVNK